VIVGVGVGLAVGVGVAFAADWLLEKLSSGRPRCSPVAASRGCAAGHRHRPPVASAVLVAARRTRMGLVRTWFQRSIWSVKRQAVSGQWPETAWPDPAGLSRQARVAGVSRHGDCSLVGCLTNGWVTGLRRPGPGVDSWVPRQ
jgi:hypothetical protein